MSSHKLEECDDCIVRYASSGSRHNHKEALMRALYALIYECSDWFLHNLDFMEYLLICRPDQSIVTALQRIPYAPPLPQTAPSVPRPPNAFLKIEHLREDLHNRLWTARYGPHGLEL